IPNTRITAIDKRHLRIMNLFSLKLFSIKDTVYQTKKAIDKKPMAIGANAYVHEMGTPCKGTKRDCDWLRNCSQRPAVSYKVS
ncbi:MAG TPA: hypothetical protein VFA10_07960, partial [Ktedonobacteraceae bacterium]|nr:hypothetical protein [Ktedonobacteraceae bacterium]